MSYGKRLERDHGYTAVYARYNTGAPVADNGRALAHQIERIVATYPVPLEQLVLVGHSMGGLVIRAACALPATESWTAKVTDVFFLGTPHLGAPLEKLGRVAEVVLEAHPVTRPFAKILHTRSEGVKDLRFGLGAAADGGTSGILPHARYHLVAGSMAESKSLVGRMFGDGMVRTESAGAPLGARENVVTLSGVNHGALMNDPKVYAVIEQALAPETADPKAAGGPTAAA
jgi:triacylglycerol esterase/lipase EstA (alpha/beta hydrolase family)